MDLMQSFAYTNHEIIDSSYLLPDVHILMGKVVCCFLSHPRIAVLPAVLHIPS